MKKKRRLKIKKNREKRQKPSKDINELIDELAYLDESILKSKQFLDDMYILSQE